MENQLPENLDVLFQQINLKHFEGLLDPPLLEWNSRLRTCAGRFIPGSRKFWESYPPKIEVASYLKEETNSHALIVDTLAHEMIHLWLWIRKRPYGHTQEFLTKMKGMGVSRYNPVPRARPYKYIYQCRACYKDFPARKRLRALACAACCKQHSEGRYDSRFKLVLSQQLTVS